MGFPKFILTEHLKMYQIGKSIVTNPGLESSYKKQPYSLNAFNLNLQYNNCTHIFPFYTMLICKTDLQLLFWQSPIILSDFQNLLLSLRSYNPRQNYLRKFCPSCPLSYATTLFLKWQFCGKKSPSPSWMFLPTNAQGWGFLLNTRRHCFLGKGEREELVQLRPLEKCSASIQFSQQFCSRL